MNKNMINRQIDTKTTMQVLLDTGLHKLLKLESVRTGKTIRELLDGIVSDWLSENTVYVQTN